MSNGMLPISGHSGKVMGCCQPSPIPSWPRFPICTQHIHPLSMAYVRHLCPFMILSRDGVLEIKRVGSTTTKQTHWKIINQATSQQVDSHQIRATIKKKYAGHLRFSPTFFLSFFVLFFPKCEFHSGAKGPRVRCWFKVLAEQILAGVELRAKSWPFCSLLASANFFLGLSESIKELPECSHQSFNYSW